MQEEVEQKTFNIVVSTTKLTARTILNAGKAAIQQQQAKMAGGKQSVRMLLRQNRGVSSVEIDKTNIRGFERYGLSAKRIACPVRHRFKITEMFLSAGQRSTSRLSRFDNEQQPLSRFPSRSVKKEL